MEINRGMAALFSVLIFFLGFFSALARQEFEARRVSAEQQGATVTKPEEILTANDLILLEDKARELAQTLQYLTPVGYRYAAGIPGGENLDKKNASSAFIAEYRRKVFLLSGAHVFTASNPPGRLFFYRGETPLPVESEIVISEVLDLAAADVTTHFPDSALGPHTSIAALRTATVDLVPGKTPLLLICNRFTFRTPLRTGFFKKIERETNVFERSWLEVAFPGIGSQDNCSGSPVVDLEGYVRGLLVRHSTGGLTGYAVPSEVIADFLDKKFFQSPGQ